MNAHQSRWGFHPCSYELYLKLKKLNILCQKALRQIAIWERWNRKDPKNRRRFVGVKGMPGVLLRKRDVSKISRLYEPIPEPPYPPIDDLETIELVASDYHNARTPVVVGDVKPLVLNNQKIDRLLNLFEINNNGIIENGVLEPVTKMMI